MVVLSKKKPQSDEGCPTDMTPQKPSRPSSAMASLAAVAADPSEGTPVKESWLKKNFMGRTPSLPTSLGKKKQSFLKVRSGLLHSTCR